MEIGNIIYLHIFDLEPILLVTQELKEERFCKIIEVTPVKGGKEGEQYINYKVQSLFTELAPPQARISSSKDLPTSRLKIPFSSNKEKASAASTSAHL